MDHSTTTPQIDWDIWEPKEETALLFAMRENRILLILKKRGLGAGKINAPGGRLEKDETTADAAVREAKEEVGLDVHATQYAGVLSFEFTDGYSTRCHVFITTEFSGDPIETDEARPEWCDIDKIPYDRMWADDRLWIPLMLAGDPFDAHFIFDGDVMLWHDMADSA